MGTLNQGDRDGVPCHPETKVFLLFCLFFVGGWVHHLGGVGGRM
jgi:hypothetical protein